jgi:Holliday junction resolvasome RuvABC DNA-binding subunit
MSKGNVGQKLNFPEIKEKIISVLNDSKEAEILTRRFGIGNKKAETLESIGRSFRVTRERIRQIERHILKKIDASEEINSTSSSLRDIILTKGGLVTVADLENLVRADNKEAKVILRILLESSGKFYKVGNVYLKDSWVVSEYSLKKIFNVVKFIEDTLEKRKKTIGRDELISLVLKEMPSFQREKEFINAVFSSVRNIGKTPEGELGLTKWGVVNPRNARDKIYVTLRKIKKPLHFKKITELIKEANFSKRMMGVETVHNELIRDPRFILIGRGIYALKEWGYKPGTVADVITEILKKENKPMHKDDIIKKVLKKRVVKKNTILLSLQEKPQFIRVKRSVYKLKE